MTKSLEAILSGCQAGDEQAVRILVERFSRSAAALAEALLDDSHLAEDAIQNAFVTALRRLGQLREAGAFPAWFRQIVRTEANRITRRRRESAEATSAVADPGAGPDRQTAEAELRRVVRQALARLTPARREAAELFYLAELPQADIASRLDVPLGTVKRRLYDARQQLRSMLLGYIADEPTKLPRGPERPKGPPL